MAWIVVSLDGTLVTQDPMSGQDMPTDGAIEAMQALATQGHRLTVWTSRFAPMPDSEKQRLKEQIEQELMSYGFPPIEVWTGTTRPAADVIIDSDAVTFDNDWGLALAQAEYMLEERGLMTPQYGSADDMVQDSDEGQPQDEQPEEGQQNEEVDDANG